MSLSRPRRALAFGVGFLLSFGATRACAAQEGFRPDVVWKQEKRDGGLTAQKWVFDVLHASAGTTGYGAARLVRLSPLTSTAAVHGVVLGIHLRGWLKGDYTPSKDWLGDQVVRGGPSTVLAVCETKGRKGCALALVGFVGAYFATLTWTHP